MPESRKRLLVLVGALAASFFFVWWIRPHNPTIPTGDFRPVHSDLPNEDTSAPDAVARPAPGRPDIHKSPSAAEALEQYVRKVHEVSQKIDDTGQELLQLSPAEELQIGQFLHEQTLAVAETVEGEPKARVQNILDGILKVHKVPTNAVTLTILRTDALNAFSHVGGYLYVYSPLLDFAPDDEQLEFVLAHELGHLLLVTVHTPC